MQTRVLALIDRGRQREALLVTFDAIRPIVSDAVSALGTLHETLRVPAATGPSWQAAILTEMEHVYGHLMQAAKILMLWHLQTKPGSSKSPKFDIASTEIEQRALRDRLLGADAAVAKQVRSLERLAVDTAETLRRFWTVLAAVGSAEEMSATTPLAVATLAEIWEQIATLTVSKLVLEWPLPPR